jgi:uncharacterized protein YkvS
MLKIRPFTYASNFNDVEIRPFTYTSNFNDVEIRPFTYASNFNDVEIRPFTYASNFNGVGGRICPVRTRACEMLLKGDLLKCSLKFRRLY